MKKKKKKMEKSYFNLKLYDAESIFSRLSKILYFKPAFSVSEAFIRIYQPLNEWAFSSRAATSAAGVNISERKIYRQVSEDPKLSKSQLKTNGGGSEVWDK